MKKIVLLLLSVCISPALADVTINLDAGQLTGPNGTSTLVPDNTTGDPSDIGSQNGSLLLIVDLGSSNTVDNALTSGNYVSGTNLVLGAGGFNTFYGTNETSTVFQFALPAGVTPGSDLALRWFPQITFAEFESGAVPSAGDYFGTYSPNGGNPDGGDMWTVPSDGATISLNLYTEDSDGGGTQPDSAGFASFQVAGSESTASVPEPSTSLLLLFGLPAMFWAVRRRGSIGRLQKQRVLSPLDKDPDQL